MAARGMQTGGASNQILLRLGRDKDTCTELSVAFL